jgi:hypothetical protein
MGSYGLFFSPSTPHFQNISFLFNFNGRIKKKLTKNPQTHPRAKTTKTQNQ